MLPSEATIKDHAVMALRYLKVRSMAAMDLEWISKNCETALGFDDLVDKMPNPDGKHLKGN
jgi:hypothetical protein